MICLVIFGLYLQFNIATALGGEAREMGMFLGQLRSLGITVIVFLIFFFSQNISNFLYKGTYIFCFLLICFLTIALIFNKTSETGRWTSIMNQSFQPSQLAHPVLIILYARIIEKKQHLISHTGILKFFPNFWFLIFFTVLTFLLIYKGKHLSTLIVLGSTLFTILFVAKFKLKILVVIGLATILLMWHKINHGESYRKPRINLYSHYNLFTKYFGNYQEQKKIEHNQVMESLTAISQGGYFGTGSEKGRAKHKFLGDINSDYLFAMIAEQHGLLGGLMILSAFFIFMYRCALISISINSIFKKLLVFGMSSNIFFTALINMSVAMSVIPSTGLPLPFMSHGGTALLVNGSMLAIILNLSMQRKVIKRYV